MIDYSKWDEKVMSVMGLALDPRNPRIPSGDQDLDERSLIDELVRHEKVYELAKDISENGFFPVEALVAFADGSKNVVLEGNRRLAALKLLLNPDLAPLETAKKFKTLAALSSTDSLKKVRVVFAPSREAAAPLIMQKHTKEQIERWSPLMQARYFRSLMAGGLSVEDLSKRYKLNKGEVTGFLRLDAMYEASCALPLPEPVKKVVHDPREFSASVLQRLIDSPKGREFLGVTFDSEGALQGAVQVAEFKKGLSRVLTDIVTGEVDTRKLNSVKEIEGYLDGLGKDAPDRTKVGSFSLKDVVGGGSSSSKAASKPRAAKTATTKRLSRSLLAGVRCRVSNQKIREVFEEVRKLDVEKFPNTTAAMLRILLELCVGNYLDKTNRMKALLAAARAKGKPKDWYPTWKQMLQEILKENLIEVNPMARKRLTKLVNDPEYTSLDGYVHNRFVSAHARELRDLGGALEDIFTVVLTDPAPDATKAA